MCVPGAITATSAASMMRNPAEAARAPGREYTTTGVREAIMRDTIVRVESSEAAGRAQHEDDATRAGVSARVMTLDELGGDRMDDAVDSATTTAGAGD